MKIIKEGKDPNQKIIMETVRLECFRCGCVFEVDDGEYNCSYPRSNPNDKTYTATCPNDKCKTNGGMRHIAMRSLKTIPKSVLGV